MSAEPGAGPRGVGAEAGGAPRGADLEAAAGGRSAGARVAYLFARYPVPSQTFCDSEMLALEALGLPLEIHATSPPRTTFRHERLLRLRAPLFYLPPPRMLRAHQLRAEREGDWPAGLLGRQETLYGDDAPVATRMRQAVALADLLPRRGVTHVHAHFAGHAAHVARLLKTVSGLPYSFTAHAQDFLVDVPEPLLRELCLEAERVIAVSDWSRDRLRDLCPEAAGRIVRVHNGIDPDDFTEPAALPERERPRIVSIGRMIEFKGFHHLIAACAELRRRGRPFACTLVGDGPWRERLERQAADAGLAEDVRFAGWLSLEEVKRTLRDSDVFALASVVDASGASDVLPTVILEAMASGLPVVGTRLVGIPEMVEEGGTGLLAEPGDAAGLAACLERVLASRDLRRSLGSAGRKRVAEHFGFARTAPELRGHLLGDARPVAASAPVTEPPVVWLLDQWPPRRSERLGPELAWLCEHAPDVTLVACALDPDFEPTARGGDLLQATRVELLPDGIVLEAAWQADDAARERIDLLRVDAPSFFAGEDYYREARRALHLREALQRRGVRHVHAARATSMLCVWILKHLWPEVRVSFALDRRTASSRRAYARLARAFDLGAVSDDLLFDTVRGAAGDALPLVTPLPGRPGRPRLRPLRPLRGWLRPARGPALERGLALPDWLARLSLGATQQ